MAKSRRVRTYLLVYSTQHPPTVHTGLKYHERRVKRQTIRSLAANSLAPLSCLGRSRSVAFESMGGHFVSRKVVSILCIFTQQCHGIPGWGCMWSLTMFGFCCYNEQIFEMRCVCQAIANLGYSVEGNHYHTPFDCQVYIFLSVEIQFCWLSCMGDPLQRLTHLAFVMGEPIW